MPNQFLSILLTNNPQISQITVSGENHLDQDDDFYGCGFLGTLEVAVFDEKRMPHLCTKEELASLFQAVVEEKDKRKIALTEARKESKDPSWIKGFADELEASRAMMQVLVSLQNGVSTFDMPVMLSESEFSSEFLNSLDSLHLAEADTFTSIHPAPSAPPQDVIEEPVSPWLKPEGGFYPDLSSLIEKYKDQ